MNTNNSSIDLPCMFFTNEEIIEYFAHPLQKYGFMIDLRDKHDKIVNKDNDVEIEYIILDGKDEYKTEFFISFNKYITNIFIFKENFMFIDDEYKIGFGQQDTYGEIVYEGKLRGKSHREILSLLSEITKLFMGVKEVKVESEIYEDIGRQYPKYNYKVKLKNNKKESFQIKYDNIVFYVN